MYSLLKTNKAFVLPYFVFLLVLIPVLFIFPKGSIHLYLNSLHNPVYDYFFKYITHLGDGWMPVILAVIFLFISLRKSVVILSSGLLAGILAQFFKRLVFPDIVRPMKYFEAVHDLYLVEGVNIHSSFSFPSGHSATIFALCLCLAIYTKRIFVKSLLFLLAVIVAFSRVYLSQHFLNDIVAGSLLGCIAVILMYFVLANIDKVWFDKSLMKLINQKNTHE
jgi:membrane-associated phospholipid phosphatase